jgi:hypothetical protein
MIAKSIVDNPDKVEVTEIEGRKTSVIELRVAEEDTGKIIGKNGNTITAIRTILSNAGRKRNMRVLLEIIDRPPESDNR